MLGTKILEEKKSKYNGNLKVVRSLGLGTYIQAGNLTQSGGIVESMWKQTLKKIINSELQITNCLILGLGGGTVVKQIHKNWPTASITGVDIDKDIVELGKKYLKLDTDKLKIIIGDACQMSEKLKVKREKFDLIIVDLYNGDQFPKEFEKTSFLKLVRSLLITKGLIIFNRLYYKDKKIEAEKFGKILKKVFKNVEEYKPLVNIMFICS